MLKNKNMTEAGELTPVMTKKCAVKHKPLYERKKVNVLAQVESKFTLSKIQQNNLQKYLPYSLPNT